MPTRFIPLDGTPKKNEMGHHTHKKKPQLFVPPLNFIDGTQRDGTHTHSPDPMFEMGHMRWDTHTHTVRKCLLCDIVQLVY